MSIELLSDEETSGNLQPQGTSLFHDRFRVLDELGKGRYGTVRKVIEKSTSMNYAAKFVKMVKSKDRKLVHAEIEIMKLLRHPKLLHLMGIYESPKEMILVTE